MVCSECGLVLESHSIDETSEWRTFANESRVNDSVRVGGPTNPLLTDGGISTVISKPNGVMSNKALLSSSPFKPTILDSNKSNTGLEDGDGSLRVSGGGKEEIVCRTVEPVWNHNCGTRNDVNNVNQK